MKNTCFTIATGDTDDTFDVWFDFHGDPDPKPISEKTRKAMARGVGAIYTPRIKRTR